MNEQTLRQLDSGQWVVQTSDSCATDIEHFIDVTDATAASYFKALDPEGFKYMALQLYASDATGATFNVYATLDMNAAIPATNGTPGATWIEVTSDLFGAAVTGTTISELSFIDKASVPRLYLIKYVVQNASNTVDVWVRKY